MTDDKRTSEQQVPGSADHQPEEPTTAARVLHGDNARGEVFDQPEAVVLDGDTRVAVPATEDDTRS